MKKIIIYITILLSPNLIYSQNIDSLTLLLDETIENRDYFDSLKTAEIEKIIIEKPQNTESAQQYFNYYYQLTNQYQTFKFDSAYYYSKKLKEIAYRSNNHILITRAKITFSNVLISGGLFDESLDTLYSINLHNLPDTIKANYYEVLSRAYFDMESFSQSSEYAQVYRQKGLVAFDSATMYMSDSTWQYHSLIAQKNVKLGNNEIAITEFENIIETYNLSNDDIAILLMQLAFLYGITGDNQKEIGYLIEATIADLKSAKKEGVALLYLADRLYESQDIIRASKYINIALADNRFYGSNFRLWQVSNFLPFIKAEHIGTIEKQKKQLLSYLILVSILALLLLFSFFIILKQKERLHNSKIIIEEKNNELVVSNEELMLANRVKEKYIGHYFEKSSQLIEKLNLLKQTVSRKLKKKQYEELKLDIANININKEKSDLYLNFDQAFLKLFPDFINKINLLLKDNEQIQLKEDQLLNSELRIFALIRLGINDANKLARILDHSVNTIYAYKSKLKNKAKNPEQFEQDVLLISSNIEIQTQD